MGKGATEQRQSFCEIDTVFARKRLEFHKKTEGNRHLKLLVYKDCLYARQVKEQKQMGE